MKKIVRMLALALVIVIAASSIGCGEPKRPEYISDSLFQYGSKAIEIIDDYLDRKISQKEAKDELQKIEVRGRIIQKQDHEEGTREHTYDTLVTSKVWYIGSSLDYNTRSEILEDRNDLADMIGVKPRK